MRSLRDISRVTVVFLRVAVLKLTFNNVRPSWARACLQVIGESTLTQCLFSRALAHLADQ